MNWCTVLHGSPFRGPLRGCEGWWVTRVGWKRGDKVRRRPQLSFMPPGASRTAGGRIRKEERSMRRQRSTLCQTLRRRLIALGKEANNQSFSGVQHVPVLFGLHPPRCAGLTVLATFQGRCRRTWTNLAQLLARPYFKSGIRRVAIGNWKENTVRQATTDICSEILLRWFTERTF